MSDIIKKWYEKKDNIDEMGQWNSNGLKRWEQFITAYFPVKAHILDVGCGMGREAFALSDMGFSVTGIDISEEAIEQVTALSRQKGYDALFTHYDGHYIPFEENTFDVVIIWAQTFGLLYGDEYKQEFLGECKRVLKNSGLLSFSGHDYEFQLKYYKNNLNGKKFYAYANADIYWESFYLEELKTFAEKAGFSVILCEKGVIYTPEDGTILHCLCKNKT